MTWTDRIREVEALESLKSFEADDEMERLVLEMEDLEGEHRLVAEQEIAQALRKGSSELRSLYLCVLCDNGVLVQDSVGLYNLLPATELWLWGQYVRALGLELTSEAESLIKERCERLGITWIGQVSELELTIVSSWGSLAYYSYPDMKFRVHIFHPTRAVVYSSVTHESFDEALSQALHDYIGYVKADYAVAGNHGLEWTRHPSWEGE